MSRYDVRQKGDEYRVRVIDDKGQLQAEVGLSLDQGKAQQIELKKPDGSALRISVGPEMKWVEVRDPATGSSGRSQLDTGAMKVEKDAGFIRFEKERGEDMRLALEAVSRVSTQGKQ